MTVLYNGDNCQTELEPPLPRFVSAERDGYVANTLRRIEARSLGDYVRQPLLGRVFNIVEGRQT